MININTIKALLFLSVCVFLYSCGGGDGSNSRGDRWKYLGDMNTKKDKTISVYLDTDSIEIYDNIRKFWIKYVVKKKDDKNVEGYVIQRGYWEVDCFDRKLFRLKEEYYTPSSRLVRSTDERVQEKYSGDQSLGAKMSHSACRYAGR